MSTRNLIAALGSKSILFSAAFLFLGSGSLHAETVCDFNTSDYIEELSDLSSLVELKVTAKNYRKWTLNGLKILKHPEKTIPPARKKTYAATVVAVYPFGECRHKARIRQNGDWKGHIQIRSGHIYQSINVKLRSGNIANIVRFKLFLRGTRNSENEVIATSLLQDLDILTPRTRLLSVEQNGRSLVMLFQENPVKEFLEFNGRREGPVFEGDESLLWDWKGLKPFTLEHLALARLVNEKWASRGASSLEMSVDALTILQSAYMEFANSLDTPLRKRSFIDPETLSNGSDRMLRKWRIYTTFLMAARATHALRPHNRKFFWNAFEQGFEPIYYDGGVQFSGRLRFTSAGDKLGFSGLVTQETIDELTLWLAGLDRTEFRKRLEALGHKTTESKLKSVLKAITSNLTDLKNELQKGAAAPDEPPDTPSVERYLERLLREVPDYRVAWIEDGSVRKDGSVKFEVCNKDRCQPQIQTWKEAGDLISAETLTPEDPVMFIGRRNPEAAEAFVTTEIGEPVITVAHSPDLDIRFDQEKRELILAQKNETDWALISNTELRDFRVVFNGVTPKLKPQEPSQRFNKFGLTGCLNFYGVIFDSTEIEASAGRCEDSLNIVASQGHLSHITVTDAVADAFDIDFSDLRIGSLQISAAGNDCLDVSSGRYELASADLSRCGDKGLSVGEASRFSVKQLKVEEAEIGVSSKDSSITEIDSFFVKDVKTCAEAFQKKQEFSGARLTVNDGDCGAFPTYADENSKILLQSLSQ